MSSKPKNVCIALNYIHQLHMLVSAITGFALISDFASLVGIPIGIKSYAVRLRIYAITAGIKKI